MRYRQNAVLGSLRRAQQFFERNSEKLGHLNPTIHTRLAEIVEELSALSVEQITARQGSIGETSRIHALRVALRFKHMLPIVSMARYKLPEVPEFAAFTMPRGRVTSERLVVAAKAFAEAATPHAQTLMSGLWPTFLEDLHAATQALTDAIDERGSLVGRRSGATEGLADAVKRGRGLLRALNAIVLAEVGEDAQLRQEWATASRIRQKPGPRVGAQSSVSTGGETTAASAVVPALVPTSVPMAGSSGQRLMY
ncbi:MAG TPA: hypothetical protein VGM82_04240 [Gemmatimonadaceae bacterium]|jgi:hypothetical protein